LCPPDASGELGEIHFRLGELYLSGGLFEEARGHFESTAQLMDGTEDRFRAALARWKVAVTYYYAAAAEQEPSLRRTNLERALAYAEAALRDCEYYGERAALHSEGVKELLEEINRRLSE
jgi:hypothetical protein